MEFLLMPPELRNAAYEAALHEPNGIDIRNHEIGLLLTCKTIRAETEAMFYAQNHFLIDLHQDCIDDHLSRWLLQNPMRLQLMQSLTIRCHFPSVGTVAREIAGQEGEPDFPQHDFAKLVHLLDNIREAILAIGRVPENVVRFEVNGASDGVSLDELDSRSSPDDDDFRASKFLLLTLSLGSAEVMRILNYDSPDPKAVVMALDQQIQNRRAEAGSGQPLER